MGTLRENSLQMVPRQTDPSFNDRLYIYISSLSLSPNLYPDDRKHQAIQVLIV